MELRTEVLSTKKRQLFKGERVNKNKHDYLQIFFSLNGQIECKINEKEYVLKQGQGVVVLSNMSHEVLPVRDVSVCIYDLKFYVYDAYIFNHLLQTNPVFQGGSFVETLLDYLYENNGYNDVQNNSNIDTFLCTLLIFIFRENLRYDPNSSLYIIADDYHSLTRRVMFYIEHHFDSPFSMDNLSKSIGYHKNYISTLFKKDTGFSVIDYLNFVRVRQAAIDIIYNLASVSTVSMRTGFNSPNHFGRVFKSIVGITPNGLRCAVSKAMKNDDIYLFTYEDILSNKKLYMEDAFGSMQSLGKLTNHILDSVE